MTENERNELVNEQLSLILDRKAKLDNTDYVASKVAEGAAEWSDYGETFEKRRQWREEVNRAEARIEELRNMEVEEESVDMEDGGGHEMPE